MQREPLSPEEAMEIEIRLLKEAAARFDGLMRRERKKRRAAYRRARAACCGGEAWDSQR